MESDPGGTSNLEESTGGEFYQELASLDSFDAPKSSEVRPGKAGGEPVLISTPDPSAASLLTYSKLIGLPVPDARCFLQVPGDTLWIGTSRGLARKRSGVWRYFAGRRWLPHDTVTALALDSESRLHVSTPAGVSILEAVPMTLEQKAEHYESITAARHNRAGFVASCSLPDPGELSGFLPEATDNDGLWTSLYAFAECLRWATTRDPRARELARRSMEALQSLVRVTGISGFPARAIIRSGERVLQSDPGPNWRPSPLDPHIVYKDDTSSDEIDGHYLAWYSYSELAASAAERQDIAQICRAVTDHILEHNLTLVGPTGKPTSWGVWSPEKLNGDSDWRAERGLNSLEILSHLKVAAHLCGEPRFEAAYHFLIDEHGYADNTLDQKIVPPVGENNHSDDELAACAYYPLLQLEKDPRLRAIYVESLERTHAVLKPEGSPFYNALYAACTGEPFDRDAAIQWLQDTPWDLRDWRMSNSHRADVELAAEPDRFGNVQLTRVLPPGERCVTKWNSNPYQADTGTDGTSEEDGTFWLLPYWMCRYHKLI